VSYTTRKPREGEIHGKNYFFVSREEFEAKVTQNDFLENVEYSGNFYGTSKSYINSIQSRGKICVLDIDLVGAEKLVHKGFDSNIVFIIPPSVADLYKRLEARGDCADQIESRINIAKLELESAPSKTFINKRIVNDKLEVCYEEVLAYLSETYTSLKFK
jgi:guanylate kinase